MRCGRSMAGLEPRETHPVNIHLKRLRCFYRTPHFPSMLEPLWLVTLSPACWSAGLCVLWHSCIIVVWTQLRQLVLPLIDWTMVPAWRKAGGRLRLRNTVRQGTTCCFTKYRISILGNTRQVTGEQGAKYRALAYYTMGEPGFALGQYRPKVIF